MHCSYNAVHQLLYQVCIKIIYASQTYYGLYHVSQVASLHC